LPNVNGVKRKGRLVGGLFLSFVFWKGQKKDKERKTKQTEIVEKLLKWKDKGREGCDKKPLTAKEDCRGSFFFFFFSFIAQEGCQHRHRYRHTLTTTCNV
jgi:hypothetical protein